MKTISVNEVMNKYKENVIRYMVCYKFAIQLGKV